MIRVATVGFDYTVRIWDADTGDMLTSSNIPFNGQYGDTPLLSCYRDGFGLVTSNRSIVSIWSSTLDLKQTIDTGAYILCV